MRNSILFALILTITCPAFNGTSVYSLLVGSLEPTNLNRIK